MRCAIAKDDGFSLIELVIILSIVGILAALAVLSSSMIDKERISSATKQLQADLEKARADAMTLGFTSVPNMRGVGVRFASPTSYVIFKFSDINPATAGNYKYDSAAEEADAATKTNNTVQFSVVSGPNIVIFDRFGFPRQADTWDFAATDTASTIITVSKPGVAANMKCVTIGQNSIREGFWNGGNCTIQ